MTAMTKIEWCDSTFNPWIGCTKVGPGCDHCYAESMMDKRLGKVQWGAGNPRSRTSAANWKLPERWNVATFIECPACRWRGELAATGMSGKCPGCGAIDSYTDARRRVFCSSLADVFDNEVDPQWRADLFALIRATPSLDWLVLTKRVGNAGKMIADAVASLPPDAKCGSGQHNHTPIAQWPWPNVWIGATVVNQAEADRDVPKLLAVPARVRFLSVEPMLGLIDLWNEGNGPLANKHPTTEYLQGPRAAHNIRYGTSQIDWIICGGESGRNARPIHPDWARSLRDQCAAAGVAFNFKQWGVWWPLSRTDGVHHLPFGAYLPDARLPFGFIKKGKKSAGRLLDGIEHNGFPEARL